MENTILVMDEQPLFREALCQLLRSTFHTAIVIDTDSAEKGLQLSKNANGLHLILMDTVFRGFTRGEVISTFRRANMTSTIVVISALEDRLTIAAAFHAGAQLFISKSSNTAELIHALHRAISSKILKPEYITPAIRRPLVDSMPTILTPRQAEVLNLVKQGFRNKAIANCMNITEVTVKYHISSIFRFLGVSNRTEAVLAARRLNL